MKHLIVLSLLISIGCMTTKHTLDNNVKKEFYYSNLEFKRDSLGEMKRLSRETVLEIDDSLFIIYNNSNPVEWLFGIKSMIRTKRKTIWYLGENQVMIILRKNIITVFVNKRDNWYLHDYWGEPVNIYYNVITWNHDRIN